MAGEASVSFTGNTTSEATLRFTPSGVAACSFTVAVAGRKKDGDQWVDDTVAFYRCTVWRDMAEHVAGSLDRKGIRVFVSGRLKPREYQDRDGKDRMSLDVDVDSVGPDLRFAAAHVEKAERGGGGGFGGSLEPRGGGGGFGGSQAADPWATGPSGADAPPF